MSDDGKVIERVNCNVRDGLFVEPCSTLEECTQNPFPGFSKKKGISRWDMKRRTDQGSMPSRTYFGIMCDAYPNGMLLNWCPFCGTDISGPFQEKEDPSKAQPETPA